MDHKIRLDNPTPTETAPALTTPKASKTQGKSAKGISLAPIQQRYNKIQVIDELASQTGLHRNHVDAVLDELVVLIHRHITPGAVGEFLLSGLVKITTSARPAQRAYVGKSTFTEKTTVFPGKPASTAVKIEPLKGIKEMAQ
jgi:hypothetical protein|tara:strand:- start:313 stop:738 length:426 start_codon:yes stop_codon:yes gene_type:complete